MSLNRIKINNDTIVGTGIVYDISKATNQTYMNLDDALGPDGENVPLEFREGGMSVRYILTFNDEYVQYFLTKNTWSSFSIDWTGIDLIEKEIDEINKEISGKISEDDAQRIDFYISASNLWESQQPYYSLLYEIDPNQNLMISNNSQTLRAAYSFLTDIDNIVAGQTPHFAGSATSRTVIKVSDSITTIAPADAYYLCVTFYGRGSRSVFNLDIESIKRELFIYKSIPENAASIYEVILGSNQFWTEYLPYYSLIYHINPNSKLMIQNNSQTSRAGYAFLTDTNNIVAGQTPHFAGGATERSVLDVSSIINLTVPTDGHYLCITYPEAGTRTVYINGSIKDEIENIKNVIEDIEDNIEDIEDIKNEVEEIKDEVEEIKDEIGTEPQQIPESSSTRNELILSPDNKWTTVSSFYSLIYETTPNEKIKITNNSSTSAAAYGFLTDTNNIVSGQAVHFAGGATERSVLPVSSTIELLVPSDGHYLCITYPKAGTRTVYKYKIYLPIYNLQINPLIGKTVAFIGDSITEKWTVQNLDNLYHKVFCSLGKCNNINLGVGGTLLTTNAKNANVAVGSTAWCVQGPTKGDNRFITRVKSEYLNAADLIVVFGGTNDFTYDSKSIGDLFVEQTITTTTNRGDKQKVAPSDTDKFAGALHELILAIRAIKPVTPIVFMTPLNRGNYNSSNNPTSAQCNSNGDYLQDYTKAIKEICSFYSIPVFESDKHFPVDFQVDSYNNLKTGYSADGLHPNDKGHILLGKLLYKFVCDNVILL